MTDPFNITLGVANSNTSTSKLSEKSNSTINISSKNSKSNKLKNNVVTNLYNKQNCLNLTKKKNTLKDHFKCKRSYFDSVSQAIQSTSKDIKDSTPTETDLNQSDIKRVFSKYGVNYSDKSLSDEFQTEDLNQFKDNASKLGEFHSDGGKGHIDLLDYCKKGNKIDEDRLIFLKEIEIQNDLLKKASNDGQNESIGGNNQSVDDLNEYQKLLNEDFEIFQNFILNDSLLNRKRTLSNEESAEKPRKLFRSTNSLKKANFSFNRHETYNKYSRNEQNFSNRKEVSLNLTNNTSGSIFSNEDEFISLASQSFSQRRIDCEINTSSTSSLIQSQVLKFPHYSYSSDGEVFISLASQNVSECKLGFQNNIEEFSKEEHQKSNLRQKVGVESRLSSQPSEELVNPKIFLQTETTLNKSESLENNFASINRTLLKVKDTNITNKIVMDDLKRNSFADKITTQKNILKDNNCNKSVENIQDPIQEISSQNYASKDHILKKTFVHALRCDETENFPLSKEENYKIDVEYLKNFIEDKLSDIEQYMYKNQIKNDKNVNIISQVILNSRVNDEILLENLESQDIFSQPIACTTALRKHSSLKYPSQASQQHLNSNDSENNRNLREAIDAFTNDRILICEEEYEVQIPDDIKRRFIIGKIKDFLTKLLGDVKNGGVPVLQVRNQHDWSNCVFDENKMVLKQANVVNKKKISLKYKRQKLTFNLIIFIMGKIVELLIKNSYHTKRELYYQMKNFTKDQTQINNAVDFISCLLDEPPWDFGILAMSKGLVYGDLVITLEEDEKINYNIPGGALVPQNQDKIKKFESNASFILIVEKDSIFQKLLDEDILNKLPRTFIMITGKGFPDVSTRLFIKKLWQVLRIPAFILVDADPYGIEIMLTYRFGSLSLLHLSEHLALPQLRWIGVHPSEIIALNIVRQILTDKDKVKIRSLLERPYINFVPRVKNEIEIMLEKNFKAEIEGLVKSNTYLGNFYIPGKLFSPEEFL